MEKLRLEHGKTSHAHAVAHASQKRFESDFEGGVVEKEGGQLP